LGSGIVMVVVDGVGLGGGDEVVKSGWELKGRMAESLDFIR